MHQIISNLPLTVIDLPTGTFAVSGSTWIKVPKGTKREDIQHWWTEDTHLKEKIAARKADTTNWMCLASNGRDQYTISYIKSLNKWKCNCIGFKTHGTDCKHIKKIKAQENL
jgi:hypothetical protein